ncbi:MAG TPA: hypothetical protein VJH34_02200 [archaeon]|nr:hypothetical protein [archaeon]
MPTEKAAVEVKIAELWKNPKRYLNEDVKINVTYIGHLNGRPSEVPPYSVIVIDGNNPLDKKNSPFIGLQLTAMCNYLKPEYWAKGTFRKGHIFNRQNNARGEVVYYLMVTKSH